MLYELCTGVSFAARSPRGAAGVKDLEPPSTHTALTPVELDRLLLAALAPAAPERPSSAAFLAGLQRMIAELAPPERLSRLSEELGLFVARAAERTLVSAAPAGIDAEGTASVSRPAAPPPFAPLPLEHTPATPAERTAPRDELLQGETLILPASAGEPETETIETAVAPPEPRTAVARVEPRTAVEPSAEQTLRAAPRRRSWPAVVLGGGALLALAAALAYLVAADGGRSQAPGAPEARAPLADLARRDAAPAHDRPRPEAPGDRATPRPPDSALSVEAAAPPSARTPPRPRRPAAPGHLSLNASPWARVLLDGRMIGTTPLFQREVPSGWHELRLVGANGRTLTRRVRVRPGEHLRLGKLTLPR